MSTSLVTTHSKVSDRLCRETEEFAERVRANQNKLAAEIKTNYDFIVCGSGSSGSVVAARLKVYGVDNLRIADGSILPRVTTGNTMAPCVIIGERASDMLKVEHKL